MENLYLLQFACFLFMLFNVLVLGITRLHMKWLNRRYEQSRWLILTALVILAMQYLTQMLLGIRAKGDAMGAVCNMLVYPPLRPSENLDFLLFITVLRAYKSL